MKVVVDAGPIVALSKAGHLTLLSQLFDEVIVPQSVMGEVAGHGEGCDPLSVLVAADERRARISATAGAKTETLCTGGQFRAENPLPLGMVPTGVEPVLPT